MKIAIYGSADEGADSTTYKKAYQLGILLAKRGHTIITGACPGLPFEVARAAHNAGGQILGFSPAINKTEHTKKYKEPIDYHTKLIFVPKSYEYSHSKAACYKYRNISSALNADKVIIIGGRFGTLNEFTLAYEFGKEIGVLKGSGGAAKVIETEIMEAILQNIDKETGAKVFFNSDPKELLKIMHL